MLRQLTRASQHLLGLANPVYVKGHGFLPAGQGPMMMGHPVHSVGQDLGESSAFGTPTLSSGDVRLLKQGSCTTYMCFCRLLPQRGARSSSSCRLPLPWAVLEPGRDEKHQAVCPYAAAWAALAWQHVCIMNSACPTCFSLLLVCGAGPLNSQPTTPLFNAASVFVSPQSTSRSGTPTGRTQGEPPGLLHRAGGCHQAFFAETLP